MARPDKAAAVAEIAELLRNSNAAVLTEYRGLTVTQLKELRRSLSANASYAVVKNTLARIAAQEVGVEAFDGQLTGRSEERRVGKEGRYGRSTWQRRGRERRRVEEGSQ